jgi:hypothetical protein
MKTVASICTGLNLLFLIAAISAFAASLSLLFMVQQGLQSEFVFGDLALRLEEVQAFTARTDPIDVDPKLGYPIWAYVTTWPLFLIPSQKLIVLAFVALQILCLAVTTAIIFRANSVKGLQISYHILIIAACMPWFALRYQAQYMNYGIIVMTGLVIFAYCKRPILRIGGLAIALIKPALCVPALFLSPWLQGLKAMIMGIAVIISESLFASIWLKDKVWPSITKPLVRYVPEQDGDLKEWFLSGDYGILAKLVRLDYISERSASILLIATLAILIFFIAKYKNLTRKNAATLAFMIIPLVSFHRYHDIVLIWPGLSAVAFDFLQAQDARRYFSLAPILWAIHYNGAGTGSLYSLAAILIGWIFYSPSLLKSNASMMT